MDPQDVYQVRHAPAFGDPPHPGGLQHFPQLRSSVKAVGPGSSRSGGCADDATVRRWPASSSGEFEIVINKQCLADRLNTPDILCPATYRKPSFMIPFVLDIERHGGKRDPDGVGIAPATRILP
jgi:hypothetical protein